MRTRSRRNERTDRRTGRVAGGPVGVGAGVAQRSPRPLQLQPGLDPLDRLDRVRAMSERREPQIAFSARTESRSRRPDDVRLVQQLVEELPGVETARGLGPEVGRVAAAVDREPDAREAVPYDAGVVHVKVDGLPNLLLPVGGVDRGRSLLDHVRHAVELRGLAPEPERMDADRVARGRPALELLRHYREGTSRPGETRRLRKALELDGDLARAVDLEHRARHLG